MSLFGKKRKNLNKEEEVQQEILKEEKEDMIQGIEGLSETTVKEVMIPRIDVDFIAVDTPKEELIQKIISSGHSRFPVYSDSIDNVIGVLYVKDLIGVFANNQELDLQKIIRKSYFIPESKRIDSLLMEFKRQHLHIAIVIDEYGGISGIITMEDIIEEIVGDIQDEFDKEQEDIITVGDDLNESIGSDFPNEDFDSLGGFVFDLFGKVPVKYEKATWNEYDFIIQDMEGHRINMIKVIKNNDNEKSE